MLNIIMEDDDKILLFKKAGQLCQSGKSMDLDLVSEVMTYRRKKKEPPYAAIINRLDRPVSGLVLMAKNQKEAARLSALMQKQTLLKQYDAILCGKPEEATGTLVDYLLKDGKENVSKVVTQETAGSKLAQLDYEVTDELDRLVQGEEKTLTKVKIHLITGRHHQIRVQFSSRKLPLLGDSKYGGLTSAQIDQSPVGRNEIALCASSLTIDGKTYSVLPPWEKESNQ